MTKLGRAEGNDILLDGAKVSKRHLLLSAQDDGRLLLEDLSSRNGVFIDDRRVTEAFLEPGASIRIGEHIFRYERDAAAKEAPPGTKAKKVPPGYRLWITDGRGSFDLVALQESCVYLGKSTSNQIPLSGDDISRRHAMLSFHEGGWEIHDLESTNGTFVNGEPVEQASIQPGAWLRLGSGFLLALEGPTTEIDREQFEARARQELKRRDSYLPKSTQVVLLIVFLAICIALVALVLLKLQGKIG